MATDTESTSCGSEVPLPNAPYVALHPHYGMLLGVGDFEAEQAYHRGKMRLHNAWAHGWGVLWGLGVTLDLARGEVAVAAGLALDGRGRELHNDLAQCLNVARWFEAHREDAGFGFSEAADGRISFDAHVRIRHHACLSAPVPALADSCSNEAGGTAYSRVFETVLIELVPGPAPARRHRHHLLRVLAGLDAAATDADGAVLAADQAALDARAAIAAAPAADRIAAAAEALQRIAVLDGLAETSASPGDPDDLDGRLFPAAGPDSLALAELRGLVLRPVNGGLTLDGVGPAMPDNAVRSVLLPSASLQALAGALLSALV